MLVIKEIAILFVEIIKAKNAKNNHCNKPRYLRNYCPVHYFSSKLFKMRVISARLIKYAFAKMQAKISPTTARAYIKRLSAFKNKVIEPPPVTKRPLQRWVISFLKQFNFSEQIVSIKDILAF